jgi:hypothetical protein
LWPAVFRAEDAVHQDFGVSVGHTDTLFPEVMGVGDSNHRRECRRSAARLSSYMLRGLTPPPKPIPPRCGWRVPCNGASSQCFSTLAGLSMSLLGEVST